MHNLVILGTARNDSNTRKAIEKLCPFSDYELVELKDARIGHYEYDHQLNRNDDFIGIARKMLDADNIVFATPVYWYAMSGRLKVFFDRLTDLLSTHQSIGKSLKGKKTFLIASGTDTDLPFGFEIPFRMTSEYFEMSYEKAFYLKAE